MSFKEQFNVFWDRLSRSTPLFGIAASLLFMPARLQRDADEDATYRALMLKMGAEPRFPNHSVQREKEIIAVEILCHLPVLALGYFVWRWYPVFYQVFLGTWAVAFVADWVGGRMVAWNFKRRQPTPVEIFASEHHESDADQDA